MAKIRVSKIFQFEMAHALWNYSGECHNIHGHSYKLIVTVIGTPIENSSDSKNGMLIDFNDLEQIVNKEIVEVFDHSLTLHDQTNDSLKQELKKSFNNVVFLPFQPTCENMVYYFAQNLMKRLAKDTKLHSLRLYETVSSYCEWYNSDNN